MRQLNKKFGNVDQFLNQKPFKDYRSGLNEHSLNQIGCVVSVFDKKYILNNRKEVIQNMLKYNVEGDWVGRLNEGNAFKKDGFSIESLTAKYGERVAAVLYSERKTLAAVTKDKFLKNHTSAEWDVLCDKKRSNLGEEGYVKKYGKEEGTKLWVSYINKWKSSMDLTTSMGNRKNGQTLEEYQYRYGIKSGYELWLKKIEKRKYTLSLNGFIDRFGKEDGTKKYHTHIDKMVENCRKGTPYSKISQELFVKIYKNSSEEYQKDIKYFTLNEEQIFHILGDKPKIIFVDFKCGNVIIEFDGEYWHSFSHVKKRDKIKDEYLIKSGYSLLRIRESEYNADKQKTTEKCLDFIRDNYNKKQ